MRRRAFANEARDAAEQNSRGDQRLRHLALDVWASFFEEEVAATMASMPEE